MHVRFAHLMILSGFFLGGCEQAIQHPIANGDFYISQNGIDSIIFNIDDQRITLQPNQVDTVELIAGLHTLTLPNGEKKQFIVYPGNKGGIINPQREIYYAYSFFTGTEQKSNPFSLVNNQVAIGNYRIVGAIESSDALFIDNTLFKCNYVIGQKPPYELLESDGANKLVTKCFSQKELLELISQDDALLSQLRITRTIPAAKNTITENFDYETQLPDFIDSSLQFQAMQVYNVISDYRASQDIADKKYYFDLYHQHISDMAHIYSTLSAKSHNPTEKKKYADFMNNSGAIFEAGIRLY